MSAITFARIRPVPRPRASGGSEMKASDPAGKQGPTQVSVDRDPPRHRLLRLRQRQRQHAVIKLCADGVAVDLA